jgi:hypothetical protein
MTEAAEGRGSSTITGMIRTFQNVAHIRRDACHPLQRMNFLRVVREQSQQSIVGLYSQSWVRHCSCSVTSILLLFPPLRFGAFASYEGAMSPYSRLGLMHRMERVAGGTAYTSGVTL